MPESSRSLRVAAVLRRELAALLRHRIEDPALEGVEVVEVDVSPDLSLARVYLGIPGARDERQVLQGAARAGGFLRKHLAKTLALRAVPRLVFKADHVAGAAARIEELIAGGNAPGHAGEKAGDRPGSEADGEACGRAGNRAGDEAGDKADGEAVGRRAGGEAGGNAGGGAGD